MKRIAKFHKVSEEQYRNDLIDTFPDIKQDDASDIY